MNTVITIFTPTYNRSDLLKRLFESLKQQTFKNFEWLIVDDGSTDNTKEIVSHFQKDSFFPIIYQTQTNSGKHIAINRGVDKAKGELFFIVDSDDWLEVDALERIFSHYNQIKGNKLFAGVCGLKVYPNGQKTGGEQEFGILDCNSLDFRYKYRIKGDMAEVFITDILKQYYFPEIEAEKFCPEALVWNRIAQHYKLHYFYEKIYYCEYLPDGLTAKITHLRMNNPLGACMHYAELSAMDIPYVQKLKAQINFWRFGFCSKTSFSKKVKQIGITSIFILPLGFLFHLSDKRK